MTFIIVSCFKQEAVGDGRLRPRYRHLANRTKYIHVVFFHHYMKTWRHPQNRKYITVVLPSEEDRATTITCAENVLKFGPLVFKNTNGQTDRQTDTLITILCTPTPTLQVIMFVAAMLAIDFWQHVVV